MPADMIWNAILTVGLGLVGGILRYAFAERLLLGNDT
jgi:hypothetical protein